LTQPLNCRAITQADSETDLEAISRLIKTCSEDVSRYETQLEKIRISPNERATGKAWKKLKTVLGRKELQQIWAEVNNHATLLNFQLNIIQS
jgi:hypothetical protein